MIKEALGIAGYLKNFQVERGIKDPLEDKILKHSYTTSFFALLSALIYDKQGEDEWKQKAEKALTAELEIIDREKVENRYPSNFHWEFKNYSLINCYILLENELEPKLKERLKRCILSWRDLNDGSTNWRCMRALSYYLRYKQFRRVRDIIRSKLELKIVLNRQTKEGFFPDTSESYSFQYHAYILALLYQYYKHSGDESVRRAFLRGVDFIIDFIDPVGDFNYQGRGQEQIFGYGSLILSLEGAAKLTKNEKYKEAAERVSSYLKRFENDEGAFPLVLDEYQNEKAGWYEYNNLGDYLSFLGVYLLYATYDSIDLTSTDKEQRYTRFYPQLGLFVSCQKNYFIAISAGGITHIYPKVLPCTGGPCSPHAPEMERDSESNYLGPYYGGNPIKNEQPVIGHEQDVVKLGYKLADFDLEYLFCLNEGVKIRLKILPKKKIKMVPLHIAAFKKPETNLELRKKAEILTPDGKASIYESDLMELDEVFEVDIEIFRGPECAEEDIRLYAPKEKKDSRSFLELLWGMLDYLHRYTKQT